MAKEHRGGNHRGHKIGKEHKRTQHEEDTNIKKRGRPEIRRKDCTGKTFKLSTLGLLILLFKFWQSCPTFSSFSFPRSVSTSFPRLNLQQTRKYQYRFLLFSCCSIFLIAVSRKKQQNTSGWWMVAVVVGIKSSICYSSISDVKLITYNYKQWQFKWQ